MIRCSCLYAGIELASDECVIAQEKLWRIEGFCSPHELEKRIDDAETDSIQIWSRGAEMPIVLHPSFSARLTKVTRWSWSFSRPQEAKGGGRKGSGAVHRNEVEAPATLNKVQIRVNKASGAWILCVDGTMPCETDSGRPILL